MRITVMALAVAAIWGLSPIFEKLSLKDTSTTVVMTIRLLFISAVVTVFTIATGKGAEIFQISGKTLLFILIAGLLGGVIGLFLFFSAIKDGEASYVIPLAATAPLFSAFYAWAILGERITSMRLAGISLIVFGAAIMYWTKK
ncbi:EamA family transporter [Candidatus Mycalebacterium sp.]